MYVCLVNRKNNFPFIECLEGGASPTSPLTMLYTHDCEGVGDLNDDFVDYAFTIVNKRMYGFRLGITGKQ